MNLSILRSFFFYQSTNSPTQAIEQKILLQSNTAGKTAEEKILCYQAQAAMHAIKALMLEDADTLRLLGKLSERSLQELASLGDSANDIITQLNGGFLPYSKTMSSR